MKVIKPQRLGVLHRTFENDGECLFVVTLFAFFPLDAPADVLPEVDMWRLASTALGRDVAFDVGMPKSRAEVLLAARAYPRGGPGGACEVRVALEGIDKRLWIVGDRRWQLGGASEPEPFDEMPITWERAFGGPKFAANPLGKGAAPIEVAGTEIHPLPNVEDPERLVRSPDDTPPPAGFGTIDQTWPERAKKVGTYDEAWQRERYPGFPKDMDWTFFNVAPADQQREAFFSAGEAFELWGMHKEKAHLASSLPPLVGRVFVNQKTPEGEAFREVKTKIDTLFLLPHEERGIAVYRGVTKVAEDDAADVLQLVCGWELPDAPKDEAHYREVLRQRLDRKVAHIAALREGDLVHAPQHAEVKGEIDELLRLEGHVAKRLAARTERERAKVREALVARGLDPDEHMPPPPEPPKAQPSFDEIAAMIEDAETRAEALQKEAAEKRDAADAAAKRLCEENGIDYEKARADARREAGGPPKFRAKAELEKLLDQAKLSALSGIPLPAVEAALADPELARKLAFTEAKLFETYRRFAHVMPAAERLDADASTALRAEVEARFSRGESLAELDLTGADLAGVKLRGADLRGALLERANLAGADLAGADLGEAVLTRADLTGADLDAARMRRANLGGATLRSAKLGGGVDLRDAVLVGADLTQASLRDAELEGADLGEAKFDGADLTDATAPRMLLIHADVTGARFVGADLGRASLIEVSAVGVDFTGARLEKTVFVSAKADGAILRDAALMNLRVVKDSSFERADFHGAALDGANLRGTRLAGADFSDAELSQADLSECDLTGATFARAKADGARFVKADLSGASLVRANLMNGLFQKTKVFGADFQGANLFRADFAKAKGDDKTSFEGANLKRVRLVPKREGP